MGYQPRGEDLDYPGKLERRAAGGATGEGAPRALPPVHASRLTCGSSARTAAAARLGRQYALPGARAAWWACCGVQGKALHSRPRPQQRERERDQPPVLTRRCTLSSTIHEFQPIEKLILRAKDDLSCWKDGTVRYIVSRRRKPLKRVIGRVCWCARDAKGRQAARRGRRARGPAGVLRALWGGETGREGCGRSAGGPPGGGAVVAPGGARAAGAGVAVRRPGRQDLRRAGPGRRGRRHRLRAGRLPRRRQTCLSPPPPCTPAVGTALQPRAHRDGMRALPPSDERATCGQTWVLHGAVAAAAGEVGGSPWAVCEGAGRGEGGAGSGPMDGQLFQVGQLLAVREGIAPFQADFTAVDRVLDFSHLQDHLRRIAQGPAALFSLGADNAMLQLVSRGAPRVLESQVPPRPHPPPPPPTHTLGPSLTDPHCCGCPVLVKGAMPTQNSRGRRPRLPAAACTSSEFCFEFGPHAVREPACLLHLQLLSSWRMERLSKRSAVKSRG